MAVSSYNEKDVKKDEPELQQSKITEMQTLNLKLVP
jgi:hypothetical protein